MTAWYGDEGLAFSCTQCGNCCTGSAGYVWLSPEEERAVAAHLGLDLRAFQRRYTRWVGDRVSLVEKPGGDCVFLDDQRRCAIQPVKPRQCVTFPFWPRLTASRRNWEHAAARCPGMGTGRRFAPDEIARLQDPSTPREDVCRSMRTPPAS